MPKIVTDETKEKIIKWYLKDGESAVSTGIKFKLTATTVRAYLKSVKDIELKKRIEKKLKSKPKRKIEKPVYKLRNEIWDTLTAKTITKNNLKEWYIKQNIYTDISINELVRLAKERGIKVI